MKKGLLVIATLGCVFGCTVGGGIEVKKVAFVLPQGWTKAESDDKDAALAVPVGWKYGVDRMFDTSSLTAEIGKSAASNGPIDPNNPPLSPDQQKVLDDMAQGLNQMASEEQEAHLDRLRKKGIIMMCVSTGKAVFDEERTRFYLKKESKNTNWTWEDAAAAQQEKFNGKVAPTQVSLPIGKAYRMEQTFTKINGSNLTMIAYAIPNGRDLYSLRFITEEQPAVIKSIEKQVAESLRIN